MAETSNTAQLADIVSTEIFKWLKWGASPVKDVNWSCEQSKKHNDKKTHPSDVVFYYEHPYSGKTVYINTDLKSYKSASISTNSVRGDLKNLAMAIDCALISEDWQSKYSHNNNVSEVFGLLFIFNYDNSYKKDFLKILNKISLESIGIERTQRIAVFGPETINYLINVVEDLRKVVQNKEQFNESAYDFYYPNMVQNKKHTLDSYAATIEVILSPYMIVKFKDNHDKDYTIYYKEKGDTVEEFVYLIDTLSTYQILTPNNNVDLVFYEPEGSTKAMINFEHAKISYAQSWGLSTNDAHFQSIAARVMTTKIHHYDPLNERITDE